MTPKGTQSSLQEHEVLFIDFLGFAAAVKEWDDERMEKLIAILSAISDAQSDFDVEGQVQSDGGYAKYETNLINAYRVNDGEVQCPDCDGEGRDEDGEQCDTCGGDGVVVSEKRSSANFGSGNEGQSSDSHSQRMSKLYDSYDQTISEQWRGR
jgi:RecJ-like exonuclease